MSKEKVNGGAGGADGSTHLLAEDPTERPSNSGGLEEDRPGEKLVLKDGKLNSNTEASEVKFISADSQNGDAKIDIENVKAAFAGMGKEELMKFANDPFWIRMRWFLFVFFWMLWIGMLVGAVAIIVLAPKCAAPAPLKWWEQAPLYDIDIRYFKDGESREDGVGDLEGLQSKLDYIKSLGVKGVIISSIFQSTPGTFDEYTDFMNVNPHFGTVEDVKNLTAAMKSNDLHLILDFIPNFTSEKHPWFVKSVNNEPPYNDYYVWASGVEGKEPNNWRNIYGDSAWTWNENRKEYYLHQFKQNQPDLKFRSEHVIQEFRDIFKFWIEQGVSGFQLSNVEYLVEDELLTSEAISSNIYTFNGNYDFLTHTYTANLPEVLDVLKELKDAVSNYTNNEGVLAVTSNVTKHGPLGRSPSSISDSVDVLRNIDLFSSLKSDFTATDLSEAIIRWNDSVPNDTRVFWELGSAQGSRVASRLSPQVVDGLNAVLMLLPGTPITFYGDELGMADASEPGTLMSWNASAQGFSGSEIANSHLSENYETSNVELEKSDKQSHLGLYKTLLEARNSPSVMYGQYESTVWNDTVFAYTRLKSGSPGYLVAFNPSDTDVIADFRNLKYVSDEKLTPVAQSPNIKASRSMNAGALQLPAKSVCVVSFIPKRD